ncbi:nucleoid occlusion factor SlmA [Aliidiomarina maris]|uniref:Nucleoid occlusion factor SlmA n=1 Tax=Aliidiomarina maris TaxID=531312 RepID=A0A327X011_9GAMM|nr:nucleoid occlusion factor SlmA [Aliidiomarina maris]MBA3988178.1 nucleoid occlusion factor SlmA [Idiomarina sp.]MCL5051598.1 nucleoid occlusion factor SlmA [Bacillota bacterium]RAJ99121.1 TetR family transcriptional regulator [Aliidiomarina maris]RUO27722.1 nucleoid occlusion factor SlmA [Aliidiomarina maris]
MSQQARSEQKTNRRESILQSLTMMLEKSPGKPITTAALAAEVGVSEAALYRHFPSKARMFEALLDYIEDIVLGGINRIMEHEKDSLTRVRLCARLLLDFATTSPGMARIYTGDALSGEHERLRQRVAGMADKVEAQFKQILRERRLRDGFQSELDEGILANLVLAFVEGKIVQFVRSGFTRKPSDHFDQQWSLIEQQLKK